LLQEIDNLKKQPPSMNVSENKSDEETREALRREMQINEQLRK